MDVTLADGALLGEGALGRCRKSAACGCRAEAATASRGTRDLKVERCAWAGAAACRGTGWDRLEEAAATDGRGCFEHQLTVLRIHIGSVPGVEAIVSGTRAFAVRDGFHRGSPSGGPLAALAAQAALTPQALVAAVTRKEMSLG